MKFILTIITCLLLTFATFAKEPTKITLTKKNHVLLRGYVGVDSVSEVSAKLLKLSAQLKDSDIIYLVLDSGGGSVFDGIDLINVMEIIPQKVHTISFYAFSMAYSISQHADKRYIGQRGVMGQHRAKGGFQGQFADGEVEQRLKMVTKVITDLNQYEANKMGVTLEKFKQLTKDEMYVYHTDAVKMKVVDAVAQVTCAKELIREFEIRKECGLFGCTSVKFSKCPMIRGALPEIKSKRDKDFE